MYKVVGRALKGLPVGISSFKLGPLAGIPVALDKLALRPVDAVPGTMVRMLCDSFINLEAGTRARPISQRLTWQEG